MGKKTKKIARPQATMDFPNDEEVKAREPAEPAEPAESAEPAEPAEPAESAEPAEPAAVEDWEIPLACEEVKDSEPVLEEPVGASEPAASEDWEVPPLACEEVKDPEPISEEVREAVEPAVAEGSEGANMPTARGPGICEYDQPESSPYGGLPITIFIGRRNKYIVPGDIANQIPSLQEHWDKNDDQIARFPEIDDDVGHTFIHYLFTGDYQTLKPASTCDMPRRAIEYSRSVLAYHAGLRCGLDGLADHGRRFIQIFDNDIALFDVISLGRKYFPKITEDAWFSEYLTNKIMTSFEAEEGIFQQEEFFNGFGEAPDFDKFLGKIMAKAYDRKISSIRDASDLRRMDNKSTVAMAMNRESVANNKYDSASTVPESSKKWYSYAESQINRCQESSPGLAPWTDHDAGLKWKEDGCTEVESSRISLLTPRSSGEMFDKRYVGEAPTEESAHQLDPDFGHCGCAHWQQHSTREDLWKNCARCKSYILNMFAGLILNRA